MRRDAASIPDCQALAWQAVQAAPRRSIGLFRSDDRHNQIQLRAAAVDKANAAQNSVAFAIGAEAVHVNRGGVHCQRKQFLFAHSETLQKIRNHAPQKPDSKESPTLNCKFLVMERSTPERT